MESKKIQMKVEAMSKSLEEIRIELDQLIEEVRKLKASKPKKNQD